MKSVAVSQKGDWLMVIIILLILHFVNSNGDVEE